MIVKTNISYGYLELIKIFFEANKLDVQVQDMAAFPFGKIILHYDENSDTGESITFMSYRNLGFENMLTDYLIKCGIDPILIPVGSARKSRDLKELDQEWEKHKKDKFGFR